MQPELVDEARIRRLRRLPAGQGVLSVYLETEPGRPRTHGLAPLLMDVLRELRETAAADDLPAIEKESARVLDFLREEYVPRGRTLVVFSSGRRRLWEVMSLQQSLRSRARFGPRPYLLPLEIAFNEQSRVAVALVSEEDSRLLTALLGAGETEQASHEHVPGRQRQGGWSAFRYERDRAHHVDEHFKNVVAKLRELDAGRPARWLVLGGTDAATSAVAKLLPRSLRRRLAGTFREEQFEGSREVLERALAVAEAAERREDLSLAETVRDRALAGGTAALGWDETLQTLGEGRVHQLVIAAASLDSEKAERALDLAWQTDAAIEVLRGDAEQVLAANGGVGALLRY